MKTPYIKTILLFLLLNLKGFSQSSFYSTPYNSRNSGSYDRGTHLLSLNYGGPNFMYAGYGAPGSSLYGTNRRFGIGPAMLKYEFAIRDEVGLGLILQAVSKRWRYTARNNVVYTDRAFGTGCAFMGYYHFNKLINVERLDVYAGLGVNFTYQQLTRDAAYYAYYYDNYGYYYYDGRTESEFMARPCGVVGVRYYVSPRFGFNAEAGYTTFSSLNLGVTFRL